MVGSIHKSYTAGFKLIVVAKAEEIGNRAAAREFHVNERCIRRWRLDKEDLERMPKLKRAQRGGNVAWPELERALESWVRKHPDKTLTVSDVRSKAILMADQMGITNFKGCPSWCYRFLKRKFLPESSTKHLAESRFKNSKINSDEQKSSFLKDISFNVQKQKLTNAQIINVDEIPFSFHFVNSEGDKTMPVLTAGNEKLSFTCVISCSANGDKLKPFLIFKCSKDIPEGNYPADVVIRRSERGGMCKNLTLDWLYEIWRKRKGAIFDPRGILIIDSIHGHLFESVKSECEKMSTTLAVIPKKLTRFLHPSGFLINKTFENEMMKCYEKWINSESHSFTKSGRMRKASPEEIAKWVSESWKSVKVSTVIYGFKQAGILESKGEINSMNTDSDDDYEEIEVVIKTEQHDYEKTEIKKENDYEKTEIEKENDYEKTEIKKENDYEKVEMNNKNNYGHNCKKIEMDDEFFKDLFVTDSDESEFEGFS